MSTYPANDPACLEASAPAVELVIEGRPRDLGTIVVARLLPAPQRRMVGPFIFLDHMGPVELGPGVGFDVRPHPHIGLSTVTYFLAGENVHRDSLGTVQTNRPHDLNLMTAGRGVVHSERADPAFRASGGLMHGVQIWLALPEANEDDPPSFEHHPAATLPEVAPAAGVRGRVLLGSLFGATSPVRHPSAPVLADLELDAGAALDLPAAAGERGVFVIAGELTLSTPPSAGSPLSAAAPASADARLPADHLAVLSPAAGIRLTARVPTRLLLLGGPALGRRLIDWNFVASTRERIDAARQAWREQRFPKIPTDDQEFIPLNRSSEEADRE
jgi:redox-sensitive bicupin YhaK (pirin superfamily)